MNVEIIPMLADNYGYLVVCAETAAAAVVDPADDKPVVEAVQRLGVDLVAIWNTHHHWDHTAGNQPLLARGNLDVYAHAADRERVVGLTHPVEHGVRFSLGHLEVRVLHTPGHTRGGVVYLVGDAAFTGDALFGAGCGRLFEGDPETMYRSLNERIAGLPLETKIYCGHEYTAKNLAFALTVEPENAQLRARQVRVEAQRARGEPSVPSMLREELATNPFLRCNDPGVRASISNQLERDKLCDPVQVFARLRQLRDHFEPLAGPGE